MPVDTVSFWLKPAGFFDRNPATFRLPGTATELPLVPSTMSRAGSCAQPDVKTINVLREGGGESDDRSATTLGRDRREARLRGTAVLRRRCPTPKIRRISKARTWPSWARRWTTSSPTGQGRASRRARSGPRAARPDRNLETAVDAARRAAGRGLRRRPGPTRESRPLPRRHPGDGRTGARRGRAPDNPRRRPLDHRAQRARLRRRARTRGPRALRHAHRHRRRGLRRRALARDDHAQARRGRARRPEALRPDRAARLLARRRGVLLAERSAASRASSCTTSGIWGSRR